MYLVCLGIKQSSVGEDHFMQFVQFLPPNGMEWKNKVAENGNTILLTTKAQVHQNYTYTQDYRRCLFPFATNNTSAVILQTNGDYEERSSSRYPSVRIF